MKRLPIGIQTLRKIIEGDYIYIDKTKHALELIDRYQYVFLSRPRRFGKSLFIDTLYEIFTGNKELFKGLYIYDKYDFEPYPVIRIDWSGNFSTQESTEIVAKSIMDRNQELLGIECSSTDAGVCLGELIFNAYKKYGKPVVVLIDEYDKPILDNIADVKEAEKRRNFLRGLYVHLKANDAYIRFVMLTGISKFSKASIFSGLNNLEDITLNPNFATICGYTQNDLETVFAEALKGADMDKVREWYNGYNFLGEHVYNPFDILLFIRNQFSFKPYWWESGTPFSLIELLKTRHYYLPDLEHLRIDETILSSFDIEDLQIEPLLFQAGYLTIDKVLEYEYTEVKEYLLRVPNKEVQISLNKLFFKYLTGEMYRIDTQLLKDLWHGQPGTLKTSLQRLFASIPYNNYVNNTISIYEGYYASVVYAYLASLGFRLIAEDVTDRGRVDLTIFAGKNIYIIEFKVGGDDALQQIKQKRYWEKYTGQGNIFIVGINFDDNERNISKFEWEKL